MLGEIPPNQDTFSAKINQSQSRRVYFIALRYLRYKDRERIIWADAICINQDSEIEKNHQLALMGRIYSGAEQTLVWIGEDTNDKAEVAFDYVSNIDMLLAGDYRSLSHLRFHEDWVLKFLDAIAPVFDMPWFVRLWVVQELVLAKQAQLMFGTKTMPMKKFIGVMLLMGDLKEVNWNQDRFRIHSLDNLANIELIRRRNADQGNSVQDDQLPYILELLRLTEGYAYTDPRDRIYALLGLTNNLGFAADYTLNTEETFRNFALWSLSAYPNLMLLSYTRGVSPSKWNLASWLPCPDMDGLPITLFGVNHFKASGEEFCLKEAGKVSGHWSLDESGNLRVRGRVIDCVLQVGNGVLNAASTEGLRASLIDSVRTAHCNRITLGNKRYERFCRAMTLELDVHNERALPEYAEWFHRYFLTNVEGLDPTGHIGTNTYMRILQGKWARYRRFCRTSNDRFAWVAWRVETNDKICIIRGTRIPYILRLQPDGNFMLVGECWIQGLMEGEALDLPGFEWDEINLV